MRRVSRGKNKKSETNSDGDEDVSGSVKTDNDETESGNDVETPNSAGKKRNARGRVKTNEENHVDDKEDTEEQENGKPPNKKKKSIDENAESNKEESEEETEKTPNKKKKGKVEKDVEGSKEEEKKEEIEENGKSVPKSKKKSKPVQKEEKNNEDSEEYEVEKIVDQRTIKGRRQFLVRWKGYTEESDTWEQEKELNCDRLIEEFLAEQEEHNESLESEDAKEKTKKKVKGKKQDKKSNKEKKTSKTKNDESKEAEDKDKDKNKDKEKDEDSDDEKEYEVEKIIDVYFKKDKTREFLIRWKGFSSSEDTWEPEEHLNCPDLINKFIEKLEKIKSTDSRELRVNPSHTKRYTLTMYGDKRQSRRNADKQRVTYHEFDA